MPQKDQPLAVHRQGGALFLGVEEEHIFHQLPGGALP